MLFSVVGWKAGLESFSEYIRKEESQKMTMRDVAIKLNKLELGDGASACRSTVPTNIESSYCLRHCHATVRSLLGFERAPLHRVQRREEVMSNEVRPRSRETRDLRHFPNISYHRALSQVSL